jgi:hypothetical protein
MKLSISMKSKLQLKLIRRKEVWALTWQGWAVAIALLLFCANVFINQSYSFLAVTQPIPNAELLIVDGWMPDYAIAKAKVEFETGRYQKMLVVGAPISQGRFLAEYKSFADLAGQTLKALGTPAEKMVLLQVESVDRDRTLATARTVQDWLSRQAPMVKAVNLYTFGTHARRSWMVFQSALRPQVGILANEPQEYDIHRWWRSSEGVKAILIEWFGVIYTYFKF